MSQQYRTKPFIEKLMDEGVRSRKDGPISVNTLVALELKLGLVIRRRSRDRSRIWTDDHAEKIKDYWLKTEDGAGIAEDPAA
jgi:hypothetical protein